MASSTAEKDVEDVEGVVEDNKNVLAVDSVKSTSLKDVVGDEELDALLDDALSDFHKPLPIPKMKPARNIPNPVSAASNIPEDMSQMWSEEFIKEATTQFEKKIREYAGANQGSSDATAPGASSTSVATDIYKVVEAATKAALGSGDPNLESTLNDAIKGLAVNPDLMNNANPTSFSDDELSKLMGSLGMDMGEGSEKDMDDLLPFMSNMMQKLLSKELLQPVLSDIVDRYPDWLADNRDKISSADFDKYNAQYDSMKKICEEYSKEKPDDTEEIKQNRFDHIADLMLKVQSAGPPPKDLVGDEDGAAFMQYDSAISQQCSIV